MVLLKAPGLIPLSAPRSLSDIAVHDEGKQALADARPQAARDATSKARHVCARRRDGEPAGSRKTGGVAYCTHPPQARQDALPPEGIR